MNHRVQLQTTGLFLWLGEEAAHDGKFIKNFQYSGMVGKTVDYVAASMLQCLIWEKADKRCRGVTHCRLRKA